MINFLLGLVVGGVVVVVVYILLRPKLRKNDSPRVGLIERQAKEKEEDKQRILCILETQTPLTNNHIEQLLGISDATATRYLDELEKEGHVRQVGKTGKHVYYEKL